MSCDCRYNTTCPEPGDNEATLYRKWVQILSDNQGGEQAPSMNDWVYNSQLKLLLLYNAGACS